MSMGMDLAGTRHCHNRSRRSGLAEKCAIIRNSVGNRCRQQTMTVLGFCQARIRAYASIGKSPTMLLCAAMIVSGMVAQKFGGELLRRSHLLRFDAVGVERLRDCDLARRR